MKLLNDVYLISGSSFGYGHFADCNVYLVDCGDKLVMIDAGGGIDSTPLIENLRDDNFRETDISYIINTHCHYDHAGGNRKIQDLSHCQIMTHETGPETFEKQRAHNPGLQTYNVDRKLKDNERLRIGRYEFQILHTPGHSNDSICILMDHARGKILFSGDTIWPYGQPGVIMEKSDIPTYCKSVERLSKLKIDVLLPGHLSFILSGGAEHIDHLMTKLSARWSDFVLFPPHPFFPGSLMERKLKTTKW